jgi:hypothetical protein
MSQKEKGKLYGLFFYMIVSFKDLDQLISVFLNVSCYMTLISVLLFRSLMYQTNLNKDTTSVANCAKLVEFLAMLQQWGKAAR